MSGQPCRAYGCFLGRLQLPGHLSARLRPPGTAMGDLKTFCCRNPPCPDCGKRGHDFKLTYFTMCSYNFCWPVRVLREQVGEQAYRQRPPAPAAGLTAHVGTTRDGSLYPAVKQLKDEK